MAVTGAVATVLAVAVASAATPAQVDWTAAKTISDSGSDGWWPRVVSSSDGTRLTTVWRKQTVSDHFIGAASSTDGGSSWTPAAELDDGTGQPSIVGSDDGLHVSAVWYSYSLDKLRTTTSLNGGQTWAPPTDIRSTGSFTSNPFLSGSSDGTRLSAVWVDAISGEDVVQAAYSTNSGKNWSPPVDLSDVTKSAGDPHIAASADGMRVTVVFSQIDGSVRRIFTKSSTDGGSSWSAATPISEVGENATAPKVAVSADGSRVHAVFAGNDSGTSRIQATTSSDGGANWALPAFLSDAGQQADRAQLIASADGSRVTATWERSDGSAVRIQSASSVDLGTTWKAPVNQSPAGSDAEYPDIVGSDDGEAATIAWVRQDPGSENLIEAVSSADGGATWTPAQTLSDNSREAYDPALAAASGGRKVVALWSRSDGTDYRIQSAVGSIRTVPGAPRAAIATAGDGQVDAVWTPPVDDGDSAITSYTATADPGGNNCSSTTTSCTIIGLTNGTTYTVSVTATNALGTGPASAPSNPVAPVSSASPVVPASNPVAPTTTVIAKAKAGKSKLLVRIRPDLGAKQQWKFVVQVKRGDWKTLKAKKGRAKVYVTKGPKHRLTINLGKGKYRAKSRSARGYRAHTSKVVKLKK